MRPENQKYSVDKNASKITWENAPNEGKMKGNLSILDGFIALSEDEITGGTLIIDTKSEEAANERLNEESSSQLVKYLMSSEINKNKETAPGKLTISEVMRVNENLKTLEEEEYEGLVENPTHRFIGNLTLGNQTHQVQFPVHVKKGGNALSTDAKFQVDGKKWELAATGEEPKGKAKKTGRQDELVTFSFHIEAGETVYRH